MHQFWWNEQFVDWFKDMIFPPIWNGELLEPPRHLNDLYGLAPHGITSKPSFGEYLYVFSNPIEQWKMGPKRLFAVYMSGMKAGPALCKLIVETHERRIQDPY